MVALKFVKGLSYSGFGVEVKSSNPFLRNVDEPLAVKLLGSGHFALVEDDEVPEENMEIQSETTDGGNEGDPPEGDNEDQNGGDSPDGEENAPPPSDDLPSDEENVSGQEENGGDQVAPDTQEGPEAMPDPPKPAAPPKGGKGKK